MQDGCSHDSSHELCNDIEEESKGTNSSHEKESQGDRRVESGPGDPRMSEDR